MPLALLALTIAAFAIGTTEFVTVGLIPTVAADLRVSVPSAGLLVSLYAVGVAIGAPVITALTGRLGRKTLLVSLMGVFTLGNVLAFIAPTFGTLLAARVLTGMTHGVFFSVGAIIATSLVPKDKAASAIAMMFGGLTVALVTGVPLGTLVGQLFGWRATFVAVAGLGLVAMAGTLVFVPKNLPLEPPASLLEQLSVVAHPRMLLVFAMTACGYGGSLVAFTYLAPILERVTGFSEHVVGGILLLYGLSVAAGNVWGGRLADRRGPVAALKVIFGVLIVVMALLTVTATSKVLMVVTVLVWGALAFGNVPALQSYVVAQAARFAPRSVNVASGLNIAAFNVGVAAGSYAGGLIVEHFGLLFTPLAGATLVFIAFALTGVSGRLDWRDRRLVPAVACTGAAS
jgi:predicted MFS family arabinose efflux permease